MSVFYNVKKIADEAGLSINEIERRAELAQGSIYKWRDGNPTIGSVARVAKVLKISTGALIDGRDGK